MEQNVNPGPADQKSGSGFSFPGQFRFIPVFAKSLPLDSKFFNIFLTYLFKTEKFGKLSLLFLVPKITLVRTFFIIPPHHLMSYKRCWTQWHIQFSEVWTFKAEIRKDKHFFYFLERAQFMWGLIRMLICCHKCYFGKEFCYILIFQIFHLEFTL